MTQSAGTIETYSALEYATKTLGAYPNEGATLPEGYVDVDRFAFPLTVMNSMHAILYLKICRGVRFLLAYRCGSRRIVNSSISNSPISSILV